MLKRKAEKYIIKWIEGSKTALLISGARQVGKTYTVRECLKMQECNYLEINLIDKPEFITVLEQSASVDDLITNITALADFRPVKGETIFFIDEVQEYKEIVTKIKFWVDEGSFRYILSGSLLGVELRALRSVPVGYLTKIKMYPMDFQEFLIASGVLGETIDYLRSCFEKCIPVNEAVNDKMLKHLRRYLVVGGMPQAVQEYVDSGNIGNVTQIQENIIELYKRDYTKYEHIDKKLMLITVFSQIPAQLLKQNRRFNYSDIKKKLRFERLENSFLWLTYAGVAISVYNATEPRVSLAQNVKSSLLKLYSSDVGLLTCQYGSALRARILLSGDNVNLGGIYENCVAEELNSHGFDIYFYNSHKQGELDFVIEKDLSVIPIEVKSGKDYYVHSAISNVVSNEEYNIKEAIVLANCNIEVKGSIKYMPVYMAMFIEDNVNFPVLEPI
ncbi:MAG: ATP-binding protein [Lachnospiraceae bacterium]|nr:ATP-binding protein [Lachnospiraceae bacterium]